MYERFSNLRKFKVEIVSMIDGEEAGIRSATLKISGKFAYGWLRSESGDVVEIFTDKNRKGPSQDWLKYVKTHQAKSRIKDKLKTEKGSWLKMIMPKK
jgi:protein subunit release factor B